MNERFESGYLPASHKILWVVLRVGLLAWGTYGLFHGSVVEFLEAIFAIIFTHLWDFFQIFGGFSFITRVTRTLAFLPQEHNVKSIIADIISAVILFFTFPPPLFYTYQLRGLFFCSFK